MKRAPESLGARVEDGEAACAVAGGCGEWKGFAEAAVEGEGAERCRRLEGPRLDRPRAPKPLALSGTNEARKELSAWHRGWVSRQERQHLMLKILRAGTVPEARAAAPDPLGLSTSGAASART